MIHPYLTHHPNISPTAYVHPSAVVIGRVTLGDEVSVWPTAVLRGDIHEIVVGDRCNIQDGAVFHLSDDFGTILEEEVTVGHRAVVHAATVETGALIGINSVVLDGSRIGAFSIVGAGAVVPPGTFVPPRTLVLGVPARVVRTLDDSVVEAHRAMAAKYVRISREYLAAGPG